MLYLEMLFCLYFLIVENLDSVINEDVEKEENEDEGKDSTTNTNNLGFAMHAEARNSCKEVKVPD